eukprot:jgi/Mesvir1/2920/Mv13990-RA.1
MARRDESTSALLGKLNVNHETVQRYAIRGIFAAYKSPASLDRQPSGENTGLSREAIQTCLAGGSPAVVEEVALGILVHLEKSPAPYDKDGYSYDLNSALDDFLVQLPGAAAPVVPALVNSIGDLLNSAIAASLTSASEPRPYTCSSHPLTRCLLSCATCQALLLAQVEKILLQAPKHACVRNRPDLARRAAFTALLALEPFLTFALLEPAPPLERSGVPPLLLARLLRVAGSSRPARDPLLTFLCCSWPLMLAPGDPTRLWALEAASDVVDVMLAHTHRDPSFVTPSDHAQTLAHPFPGGAGLAAPVVALLVNLCRECRRAEASLLPTLQQLCRLVAQVSQQGQPGAAAALLLPHVTTLGLLSLAATGAERELLLWLVLQAVLLGGRGLSAGGVSGSTHARPGSGAHASMPNGPSVPNDPSTSIAAAGSGGGACEVPGIQGVLPSPLPVSLALLMLPAIHAVTLPSVREGGGGDGRGSKACGRGRALLRRVEQLIADVPCRPCRQRSSKPAYSPATTTPVQASKGSTTPAAASSSAHPVAAGAPTGPPGGGAAPWPTPWLWHFDGDARALELLLLRLWWGDGGGGGGGDGGGGGGGGGDHSDGGWQQGGPAYMSERGGSGSQSTRGGQQGRGRLLGEVVPLRDGYGSQRFAQGGRGARGGQGGDWEHDEPGGAHLAVRWLEMVAAGGQGKGGGAGSQAGSDPSRPSGGADGSRSSKCKGGAGAGAPVSHAVPDLPPLPRSLLGMTRPTQLSVIISALTLHPCPSVRQTCGGAMEAVARCDPLQGVSLVPVALRAIRHAVDAMRGVHEQAAQDATPPATGPPWCEREVGSRLSAAALEQSSGPTSVRQQRRLRQEQLVALRLLYALPALAQHPACVAPVLCALQPMLDPSAHPTLQAVGVRLLCRLWQSTGRLFPALAACLAPSEVERVNRAAGAAASLARSQGDEGQGCQGDQGPGVRAMPPGVAPGAAGEKPSAVLADEPLPWMVDPSVASINDGGGGQRSLYPEDDLLLALAASVCDVCKHSGPKGVQLVKSIQALLVAGTQPGHRTPSVAAVALDAIYELTCADELDFYAAWRVVTKRVPFPPPPGPIGVSYARFIGLGAEDALDHVPQAAALVKQLWVMAGEGGAAGAEGAPAGSSGMRGRGGGAQFAGGGSSGELSSVAHAAASKDGSTSNLRADGPDEPFLSLSQSMAAAAVRAEALASLGRFPLELIARVARETEEPEEGPASTNQDRGAVTDTSSAAGSSGGRSRKQGGGGGGDGAIPVGTATEVVATSSAATSLACWSRYLQPLLRERVQACAPACVRLAVMALEAEHAERRRVVGAAGSIPGRRGASTGAQTHTQALRVLAEAVGWITGTGRTGCGGRQVRRKKALASLPDEGGQPQGSECPEARLVSCTLEGGPGLAMSEPAQPGVGKREKEKGGKDKGGRSSSKASASAALARMSALATLQMQYLHTLEDAARDMPWGQDKGDWLHAPLALHVCCCYVQRWYGHVVAAAGTLSANELDRFSQPVEGEAAEGGTQGDGGGGEKWDWPLAEGGDVSGGDGSGEWARDSDRRATTAMPSGAPARATGDKRGEGASESAAASLACPVAVACRLLRDLRTLRERTEAPAVGEVATLAMAALCMCLPPSAHVLVAATVDYLMARMEGGRAGAGGGSGAHGVSSAGGLPPLWESSACSAALGWAVHGLHVTDWARRVRVMRGLMRVNGGSVPGGSTGAGGRDARHPGRRSIAPGDASGAVQLASAVGLGWFVGGLQSLDASDASTADVIAPVTTVADASVPMQQASETSPHADTSPTRSGCAGSSAREGVGGDGSLDSACDRDATSPSSSSSLSLSTRVPERHLMRDVVGLALSKVSAGLRAMAAHASPQLASMHARLASLLDIVYRSGDNAGATQQGLFSHGGGGSIAAPGITLQGGWGAASTRAGGAAMESPRMEKGAEDEEGAASLAPLHPDWHMLAGMLMLAYAVPALERAHERPLMRALLAFFTEAATIAAPPDDIVPAPTANNSRLASGAMDTHTLPTGASRHSDGTATRESDGHPGGAGGRNAGSSHGPPGSPSPKQASCDSHEQRAPSALEAAGSSGAVLALGACVAMGPLVLACHRLGMLPRDRLDACLDALARVVSATTATAAATITTTNNTKKDNSSNNNNNNVVPTDHAGGRVLRPRCASSGGISAALFAAAACATGTVLHGVLCDGHVAPLGRVREVVSAVARGAGDVWPPGYRQGALMALGEALGAGALLLDPVNAGALVRRMQPPGWEDQEPKGEGTDVRVLTGPLLSPDGGGGCAGDVLAVVQMLAERAQYEADARVGRRAALTLALLHEAIGGAGEEGGRGGGGAGVGRPGARLPVALGSPMEVAVPTASGEEGGESNARVVPMRPLQSLPEDSPMRQLALFVLSTISSLTQVSASSLATTAAPAAQAGEDRNEGNASLAVERQPEVDPGAPPGLSVCFSSEGRTDIPAIIVPSCMPAAAPPSPPPTGVGQPSHPATAPSSPRPPTNLPLLLARLEAALVALTHAHRLPATNWASPLRSLLRLRASRLQPPAPVGHSSGHCSEARDSSAHPPGAPETMAPVTALTTSTREGTHAPGGCGEEAGLSGCGGRNPQATRWAGTLDACKVAGIRLMLAHASTVPAFVGVLDEEASLARLRTQASHTALCEMMRAMPALLALFSPARGRTLLADATKLVLEGLPAVVPPDEIASWSNKDLLSRALEKGAAGDTGGYGSERSRLLRVALWDGFRAVFVSASTDTQRGITSPVTAAVSGGMGCVRKLLSPLLAVQGLLDGGWLDLQAVGGRAHADHHAHSGTLTTDLALLGGEWEAAAACLLAAVAHREREVLQEMLPIWGPPFWLLRACPDCPQGENASEAVATDLARFAWSAGQLFDVTRSTVFRCLKCALQFWPQVRACLMRCHLVSLWAASSAGKAHPRVSYGVYSPLACSAVPLTASSPVPLSSSLLSPFPVGRLEPHEVAVAPSGLSGPVDNMLEYGTVLMGESLHLVAELLPRCRYLGEREILPRLAVAVADVTPTPRWCLVRDLLDLMTMEGALRRPLSCLALLCARWRAFADVSGSGNSPPTCTLGEADLTIALTRLPENLAWVVGTLEAPDGPGRKGHLAEAGSGSTTQGGRESGCGGRAFTGGSFGHQQGGSGEAMEVVRRLLEVASRWVLSGTSVPGMAASPGSSAGGGHGPKRAWDDHDLVLSVILPCINMLRRWLPKELERSLMALNGALCRQGIQAAMQTC